MTLQHTTWDVLIPAGILCVVEGEYRSEDRLMRGRVQQTLVDRTPTKDSPPFEFGPYRGRADRPSARAKWQDRLNFRFVRLAAPGGARTFDTLLHVDIWYESEARLPEATGVDGADYSRFVTSHIEINCSSVPYRAYKVDLKLTAYVGNALSAQLHALDEAHGAERSAADL